MEKTIFLAMTICENGKYYSYAFKTRANNNLLCVLSTPNLISANVCDTFKKSKRDCKGME